MTGDKIRSSAPSMMLYQEVLRGVPLVSEKIIQFGIKRVHEISNVFIVS